MKKFISIFFLAIYLFSTTQAVELLKLPVVFQHYHEHKMLDKDMTFLAFLDIHYMHGSPHDDDYDRDMQLPFKTPIHTTAAAANYVAPAPISIIAPKVFFIEKKQPLIYNTIGYSFNYHSSVWQPPRAC
ncbi:hypothetical protein [Asinibacterium sp. OR53]|uniref:hypothetical protein n=1 Tax=Asinibacterium sp. OR53 TaxID=925409 RepID=UPI0012F7E0DE|nr:hypothetical protein [Asinibacterium sp. OR53]